MSTAPRTLVVFESMFGNTEKVAGAVARGLQRAGAEATCVDVRSAPTRLPDGLDLLVVGGPTHAFGLSRESTRADAVRQGAPADRAGQGLREWLRDVRIDGVPPRLAAFDTRVSKVRWLPQAAGPSAVHLARRRGLESLVKPVGFLVDDVQGPLVGQQLERAEAWGRSLGDRLVAELATPGVARDDG
jgi:hypothetical protein